jgi:predicted ATPase
MSRPRSRPPVAILDALWLTNFKSFRQAVLSLPELTLLIGKNGSGKSNAIDGLTALSRLAEGEDVRDALDGSRADSEPIRGGAEGCAPHGSDEFTLGCRVTAGRAVYELDVTVQVRPEVRIRWERLGVVRGASYGKRSLDGRELLVTDDPDEHRSDLVGRWFNGKRGVDPGVSFASNRLLLTQIPGRVPQDTEAAKIVHAAAAAVRAALTSVFILDPVPHLMRQYVNERDNELRRNADNLSAAVAAIAGRSPEDFEELQDLLRAMPDRPFQDISMARSNLGDVLVALAETDPVTGQVNTVPARLMSDGMLRFLAIGTALLSAPLLGQVARDVAGDVPGQRLLVIEEVENGLHPEMAARVVSLVRRQSETRSIRTLVTTHSPALLDALSGADHRGVVVCDRDPHTGWSRLTRLIDLPGYASVMARGTLGDVVGQGLLGVAAADEPPVLSDRFSRLLGGA